MKKDISFPQVEGINIAIVKNTNEVGQQEWYVYIINKNDYAIQGVIVNSRGYGEIEGEKRETSILRQLFDEIAPQSYHIVEPIDPALFVLNNEFWVSYYVNGHIYDKRFTFVPDSIVEPNMIHIGILKMKGVLHE
ncbi:MAG: hypothetical protein NW207_01570 [Cytophagales bacterium]|nr:hypothetical protein [Cytophagales bacterium]